MDLITFTAIALQPSDRVHITNIDCFTDRQHFENVELQVDSVDVDFFIEDLFGKERADAILCDSVIASLDATLFNVSNTFAFTLTVAFVCSFRLFPDIVLL